MNTEQFRADFEAWARRHLGMPEHIAFNWEADWTLAALEGYRAGRATLQSQDREDAVGRLIEVLKSYMHFGCPVCSGDCHSANPPVSGCPVREAQQAIDHARRIEGEGK